MFSVVTIKGVFKYVRIGCELVNALLINLEGMKFLVESKLLQEIAENLAELDTVCILAALILFSLQSNRR